MIRIFILLFLFTAICKASDPNLEEILDNFGEESEISQHIEEIDYLIANPLILDSTQVNEAEKLIFLNPFQIDIIKNVIRENKFTKEYLLSLESFRDYEVELILMCVNITSEIVDSLNINLNYRARYKDKLMQTRGFIADENDGTNKYEGSPIDFYQKFNNSYAFTESRIEIGLVTDRDAGEKTAFDYYAVYAKYENKQFEIITGDFYLRRGSGLILASGFAPRKGTEVIYPAYKNDYSNRPYTSTIDYRRMRGLATQVNLFRTESDIALFFDAFYSNQLKYGNIKKYDDGSSYISSVYKSGYYRSDIELQKKDAYRETLAGGGFNLDIDYLNLGATALYIDNSLPIHSGSSSVFYGKHGMLKSFYIGSNKLDFLKINAEYAGDADNNSAFIFGAVGKTKYANIALNIRSYSKNFKSPYGNAFGEFSYPSNEEGIYLGVETKRYLGARLSTYLDFFASKDSTYYVPTKVKGREYLVNLDYRLMTGNYVEILYKNEKKTDYGKIGNTDNKVFFDAIKYKIRLQYKSEFNFDKQKFRIKTGIESANLSIPGSKSQGLGYYLTAKVFTSFGMDAGFSAAKFDTDDYDSAIWFYEYSLPGYSSIMSLYLKGYRFSTFIAYTYKNYSIALRFSYLEKPDEETIGSGWDETFAPIDRRLFVQFDMEL